MDHRRLLYSTSKSGRLSAERSAAADVQDVQNHVCMKVHLHTVLRGARSRTSVAGHVKVDTAAKHIRIGGVESKDGRSEDRHSGFGGVVRRSGDINLGDSGIGRSEHMYFRVGGIKHVDAKDDKSCLGHSADRSSGTYNEKHGHGHGHEHRQKGMGHVQSQSICVASSSSVAIASSAIRRP